MQEARLMTRSWVALEGCWVASSSSMVSRGVEAVVHAISGARSAITKKVGEDLAMIVVGSRAISFFNPP